MFIDPKTISINGKVGKEEVFYFYYKDIYLVTKIESSCGCTGVRNQVNENRIVAHYTPKDIPVHLKAQGYYTTIQTITVSYMTTDNEDKLEELIFTAKITA